jgi:tetratricopeptide (TPR) repeat protein
MKGLTEEAMAEYEKAIALNDDPLPLALLGRLYARIGSKDEALKILARLREASSRRYVSPYNFALIYMGLGQKDEAIHLLEETYDDRDGYNIAFIKTDPLFDQLRGDPQFKALVQKVFAPNRVEAEAHDIQP